MSDNSSRHLGWPLTTCGPYIVLIGSPDNNELTETIPEGCVLGPHTVLAAHHDVGLLPWSIGAALFGIPAATDSPHLVWAEAPYGEEVVRLPRRLIDPRESIV